MFVRGTYNRKSICLLVPIFEGYGTRIKILEALIWNNRIISTEKGIEGINYEKNRGIIIANNKIKFSNKLTGKKSQFSLRDHLIRDLSRFDPIEESYLILRDFSQYAID